MGLLSFMILLLNSNIKIMNSKNLNDSFLDSELEKLRDEVLTLARKSKEDSILLITILRKLEFIHRQIREELFEPSLPNTRHDLYPLLKDIEESGGWPYIERMRLQNLCEKFLKVSENISEDKL
jgi:hypothetical protein